MQWKTAHKTKDFNRMHIRPKKYLRSVKTEFHALMSCLKVQNECGMEKSQTDRCIENNNNNKNVINHVN